MDEIQSQFHPILEYDRIVKKIKGKHAIQRFAPFINSDATHASD